MLDIESDHIENNSTPQEPTPTPRRRRAASRPAGPPAEVVSPVEVPTTAAVDVDAPDSDDPPVEPTTQQRRRRATRPAGSPNPSTPVAPIASQLTDIEVSADEVQKAPDSTQQANDEAAPTTLEEPVKRRRRSAQASQDSSDRPRRSRRKKTETQPAEIDPEVAAAVAAELDTAADPDTSDADQAEDDLDGIAAALKMAEQAAATRQALVANPFALNSQSRQAELDALAGAIADPASAEAPNTDEAQEQPRKPSETAKDRRNAPQTESAAIETDHTDQSVVASTDAEPQESVADDHDDADTGSEDDGESRRRRRRRGGRRRRRADHEPDAVDDSAEDTDGDLDTESDDDTETVDDETPSRRRRRRRRRRNSEDSGEAGDAEITGIDGSTRMEAKRQRRKENRAAGRRRAPIVSEAEFLARREAVERQMVIRQGEDYTQIAVIEDEILVEHYVDRASSTSLIGNVYLGKVQNVLPSMEAAFIDIGRGRNAVLYAGEVNWDEFGVTGEDRKVEQVFKSGQSVLVQVTKDPVGAKGARLTGHISLPGRYVVYSPGGHLSGISRKLPEQERTRLRETLSELITDDESVIVRTAAEGVSSEELVRDVNRLKAQWEVIEKKVKQGKAPQVLHAEPDLTLRIVRDLFTEDFGSLVVQGDGGSEDAWESISAYVGHVAPHLSDRLSQFETGDGQDDVFAKFRIDEQIAKALGRKVYLPSGGSLVIDRTEAMTVIDVNTGRFTGTGGNLEATVTSNNLEAAEEIVRQLRLRDLGGIIVIDFIDMVLPSNRELLLRRLVECLGRDRTRHQVAEVTSLGLVQLTRKRIGTGLAEAFTEECECCHGQGYHRFEEPVDSQAPADGGDRKNGSRRRRRHHD